MDQKESREYVSQTNDYMKHVNSLCTICSHNIDNELCEKGNDSYSDNSFCYMGDCEDFVLKEDDENSEELTNNNNTKYN